MKTHMVLLSYLTICQTTFSMLKPIKPCRHISFHTFSATRTISFFSEVRKNWHKRREECRSQEVTNLLNNHLQRINNRWNYFNIDQNNLSIFTDVIINKESLVDNLKIDYHCCKLPVLAGIYHLTCMQKRLKEFDENCKNLSTRLTVETLKKHVLNKYQEENMKRLNKINHALSLYGEKIDIELNDLKKDPLIQHLFKNDLKVAYKNGYADGYDKKNSDDEDDDDFFALSCVTRR